MCDIHHNFNHVNLNKLNLSTTFFKLASSDGDTVPLSNTCFQRLLYLLCNMQNIIKKTTFKTSSFHYEA